MGAAGSTVMSELKGKMIAKNLLDQDLMTLLGHAFIQQLPDPVPVDQLMCALKDRTDVFLTHNWGQNQDNHKRVAAINEGLKAKGLLTWFDSEKMEGNVKKKMTEGIDNAQCVVVCITQLYIDKVRGDNAEDNCQLEFGYAARIKTAKRMVPVVMESGVRSSTWTGEVGMVLGGVLYVDMCDDISVDKLSELYDRILSVNNGVKLSDVFDRCVKMMMAYGVVPTDVTTQQQPVGSSAVSGKGTTNSKLYEWLVGTVQLTEHAAEICSRILVGANIGSVDRLMRRYQDNKNVLSELGIDKYDAEDILKVLLSDSAKAVVGQSVASKESEVRLVAATNSEPQNRVLALKDTLKDYGGPVRCVTTFQNQLYSASNDMSIKVWDLSSHTCVATLTGHESYVYTLVCNGDRLYSGSHDKSIKVWDLSSHACVATLTGHTDIVYTLVCVGDRLYSGACDNSIKVWDLSSHACVATLTGHTHFVHTLVCVGDRLYSGACDNSIKVWDLSSHACVATLTGHTSFVYVLLCVGGRLYSGSHDQSIKVWDLSNHACVATLTGHTHSVKTLVCVGDRLYSGACDNSIKVWDLSSHACTATLTSHTSYVNALVCVGGRLYSGSGDHTIKVWDLSSHACVATLTGHKFSVNSLACVGDRL